jgi:hypothetical protein
MIPAKLHDLWVSTEDERAAIHSGATDVFRPAGLIRARRALLCGPMLPVGEVDATPAPLTPSRHG